MPNASLAQVYYMPYASMSKAKNPDYFFMFT
jgi:hypothetical protein